MTDTYVRQLAATLELAAEFRIPCPGHHHGQHADLRVTKRLDGHGDGWSIQRDGDAWTGTRWEHRGVLARSEIYHYPDAQTAIDEAVRIAPLETQAFNATIARLCGDHERRPAP